MASLQLKASTQLGRRRKISPSPAPHPQNQIQNFESGSFYLAKNRNFLLGLDSFPGWVHRGFSGPNRSNGDCFTRDKQGQKKEKSAVGETARPWHYMHIALLIPAARHDPLSGKIQRATGRRI